MRRYAWLCAVYVALPTTACHSGGSPAAFAEPNSCGLATTGPLVGYSYQTMPQPPPTGGAIPDGTYDLVQMVDHMKPTGAWSSNEAPAFRLAFRFTTQDRSPNHAEGAVVSAMDMPPALSCETGRFATVGTEFRGLRARDSEIRSTPYAVTADGWMMLLPRATFVFRRRA